MKSAAWWGAVRKEGEGGGSASATIGTEAVRRGSRTTCCGRSPLLEREGRGHEDDVKEDKRQRWKVGADWWSSASRGSVERSTHSPRRRRFVEEDVVAVALAFSRSSRGSLDRIRCCPAQGRSLRLSEAGKEAPERLWER